MRDVEDHLPSGRPGSTASLVRARVEAGGERFWHHTDFADLPPQAVALALSRLTQEGVLTRARKGLYYRPRPTVLGLSVPAASAVAARAVAAPLHPAGLTAGAMLGFSTQNPSTLEYATSATDPPRVPVNAHFYVRRPATRRGLDAEEGALLEFLRDRGSASDLSPDETVRRLVRLLNDRDRFGRLAEAALEEPPRVRAILGALGEELGLDDTLLAPLRASLNPLSRFDFGALRGLRFADRWQAK